MTYTHDGGAAQGPLAWTNVPGLAEAIDREIDRDRAFFRRYPRRDWRVRTAGPAELQAFPHQAPVPPGYRWLIAVIQFAPGERGRFPFIGAETRPPSSFQREDAFLVADEIRARQHSVLVNMWGAG